MKIIYVEAKSDIEIKLPEKIFSKLPLNIGLVTTVQHVHKIKEVKKELEKAGKEVKLIKGIHSKHAGQILGCDVIHIKQDSEIDAYLYIGTGKFHPQELLLMQEKPVFVFNPMSKKFHKLDEKLVEKIKKRKKGAYMKFLSSDKIGFMISTKPGQYNLKQAEQLEKKYPKKKFFYLMFDTIDLNELENFPFIECFVNTACPRMAYDDAFKTRKSIINVEDLLNK